MCITVHGRVKTIEGKRAILDDGRVVRLGPITDIRPGDWLEVYADLAMGKVEETDVQLIQNARKP